MITQSQIDRLRNATTEEQSPLVFEILDEWELELKAKILTSGKKINLKITNLRDDTKTEVLAVPVLGGLFAYHKVGASHHLTHVGTGYLLCSFFDLKTVKEFIVDMEANINKDLLKKFDTDNIEVMGLLSEEERDLVRSIIRKHW